MPNPALARLATTASLGASLVAALMFAAVFVIFTVKIAMRYIAHDAMAWADELLVILFIWIIFWTNAFILKESDHIRFDLVWRLASPAGKRLMGLARSLLIGGIFAANLPTTLDYIAFLWRERTPVLEWRLDHIYACFALYAVTITARAALDLTHLLGRNWRSHV